MIAIKTKLKNLEKFRKEIRNYDDKVYKAAINAVKIEGYRLRQLLQSQIIGGAPGGKGFAPMRRISQLSRQYQAEYGSRLWNKTSIPKPGMDDPALRALAIPVRYEVQKGEEKFKVKVGILKNKAISDSWRKIAYKQQTGFTIPITPLLREAFATWPLKMARAGRKPHGIFFPPEKTHLVVPPRDITRPFWRQQQNRVYANIKRNFDLKMANKYINGY